MYTNRKRTRMWWVKDAEKDDVIQNNRKRGKQGKKKNIQGRRNWSKKGEKDGKSEWGEGREENKVK